MRYKQLWHFYAQDQKIGYWQLQEIKKCNEVFKEHIRAKPNYQTRREVKLNRTTRVVFSPSSFKSIVFVQVDKTWDTYSCGISMPKSQWTGYWQLKEINKSNAVFKEHKRTNPNYQTRRQSKMVGRWFLCTKIITKLHWRKFRMCGECAKTRIKINTRRMMKIKERKRQEQEWL